MLICHRHHFLFVHIAKTAGTSVRTTLNRLRWRDPYFIPQFICSRISSLTGHRIACKIPRHAKVIAAYEMLPREVFDGLFKFAFVRNPWDLQVSSYHHLKRERPHLVGDRDFETFLRYKLDPTRPYQYHLDTSIALQSDYLVDLHGKVLVDFIGRFETLNDDFITICQRIGVQPPVLEHKRQAKDRGGYQKYYTPETVDLVARHFAADIAMFGYTFE
jgi:hypothetical protein